MYSLKSIRKIIYEAIYKKPYGTTGYLDLKQIIIPEDYLATTPHKDKIKRMYSYYFRHQRLDEPITVKSKYYDNSYHTMLLNGYIRALISWDIVRTYMNTYHVTYEKVPDSLRYVPVQWSK